jgi:hypothetical protein
LTLSNLWAGEGANAKGSLVPSGSTVTVGSTGGWFRLGNRANAAGYYTLNGGTFNASNNFKVAKPEEACCESTAASSTPAPSGHSTWATRMPPGS